MFQIFEGIPSFIKDFAHPSFLDSNVGHPSFLDSAVCVTLLKDSDKPFDIDIGTNM